MLSRNFDRPVRVWVGLGFIRPIASVFDAYQFATDWSGNSPEQRAAIRACKAALVGDIDPDTARCVFTAFLRKKDILADDDGEPTPWMIGPETSQRDRNYG